MQLGGAGTSAGFLQTTQDIVRESGVRGLYAGVGGYMVLWGTFSPLLFVLYEQGMRLVDRGRAYGQPGGRGRSVQPSERPASFGTSFVVGSCAGFAASAITSPLDVIKTRMQCQTPTSITQYSNVFEGLLEIWRNEGPHALYRGTLARSLNLGLSSGIMLGTYGMLRAHGVQRLLGGPVTATDDGYGWGAANGQALGTADDHAAPRLQTWYTKPSYGEGPWPTARTATPSVSAEPATAGRASNDHGFIRPLTRWD